MTDVSSEAKKLAGRTGLNRLNQRFKRNKKKRIVTKYDPSPPGPRVVLSESLTVFNVIYCFKGQR